MVRKVLVNIISDQTVQNVQFIKEHTEVEEFIFITTSKMESKGCSDWIIKASNIRQEQVVKLSVNEFDTDDIQNQLLQNTNKEIEYIVNITGGTKLMSIATKDFFEKLENADIFYLTGFKGKFLQLFPKKEKKENTLTHQVALMEYLNSYGIELKNHYASIHTLFKNETKTIKLYEYFCQNKIPFFKELRNHAQSNSRQNLKTESVDGLDSFLNEIEFEFTAQGELTKNESIYLTGKWLEEYAYAQIKQVLNLEEKFIGIGLVLQKDKVKQTDNDFDVMFMWENDLYIIECKTSHFVYDEERKKPVSKLTDYIYKLDALRKDFGIFPKAYIFTLSNLPLPKDDKDKNTLQQQEQIQDRLKFHNITLLTHQTRVIENQEKFKTWLENLNKSI